MVLAHYGLMYILFHNIYIVFTLYFLFLNRLDSFIHYVLIDSDTK